MRNVLGRYISIAVYEPFVLPLVLNFFKFNLSLLFLPKKSFCTSSLRCKNPFFGSTQFHWLSAGHDLCLSKVSVAADYPDSVPDSSSYMSNQAYHPLEEVKVSRRIRDTKLTSAEIARTTVEVCAYKHCRTWSLPFNFFFLSLLLMTTILAVWGTWSLPFIYIFF